MNELAIEIAETGTSVFQVGYAMGLQMQEMASLFTNALKTREHRTYTLADFEEAISYTHEQHNNILGIERATGPNLIAETLIRLASQQILST